MTAPAPLELLTIGPSHFCEKARWALDRAGLPFRERPHPPLLHSLPALRASGQDDLPILVAGGEVVHDSTRILEWVDRQAGLGLYPEGLRDEVLALEEGFDEDLGPHLRRWAYAHVLADPGLTTRVLTAGVPGWERRLFRLARPAIVWAMRKGMNITPAGAERSRARVEATFAAVDARLADGRRFLVGDRFTAADLTFAALAAPACAVEGYGPPWLPPLSELPPALLALTAPLRDRPAGAFVARLYREERRRRAA